jgi:hypothetical protein
MLFFKVTLRCYLTNMLFAFSTLTKKLVGKTASVFTKVKTGASNYTSRVG